MPVCCGSAEGLQWTCWEQGGGGASEELPEEPGAWGAAHSDGLPHLRTKPAHGPHPVCLDVFNFATRAEQISMIVFLRLYVLRHFIKVGRLYMLLLKLNNPDVLKTLLMLLWNCVYTGHVMRVQDALLKAHLAGKKLFSPHCLLTCPPPTVGNVKAVQIHALFRHTKDLVSYNFGYFSSTWFNFQHGFNGRAFCM